MTIMNNNIVNYVRSTNGNKIIVMMGDRHSFRCRQRDNIGKTNPLKFVSYKEMQKEIKRCNYEKVNGPNHFYSLCKL